jgi:hypothetical protein
VHQPERRAPAPVGLRQAASRQQRPAKDTLTDGGVFRDGEPVTLGQRDREAR